MEIAVVKVQIEDEDETNQEARVAVSISIDFASLMITSLPATNGPILFSRDD